MVAIWYIVIFWIGRLVQYFSKKKKINLIDISRCFNNWTFIERILDNIYTCMKNILKYGPEYFILKYEVIVYKRHAWEMLQLSALLIFSRIINYLHSNPDPHNLLKIKIVTPTAMLLLNFLFKIDNPISKTILLSKIA